MAKKSKKQTVKIDEVDYDLNDLSENAKAQLANLQFVDTQLMQLNNELAVSDTARIGYLAALKNELASLENSD